MALVETGIENPRGRAVDKRKFIMKWMNRWGYATPQTISEALGIERSNGLKTVNQLIKKGLLRETISGSDFGYWRRAINRTNKKTERQGPYVLMLTESGKATAIAIDSTMGAPFEKQVSGIQTIRHNLIAQRYTASMLNDKTQNYVDYLPEAMTREQSTADKKQPDVVMLTSDGDRHAIEIELSPKSKKTGALPRAFLSVLSGLVRNEYALVAYIFGSDTHRENYESVWSSGRLEKWEQAGSRWVFTEKHYKIEPAYAVKVIFLQDDLLIGDLV